jgi:hypothetical protein
MWSPPGDSVINVEIKMSFDQIPTNAQFSWKTVMWNTYHVAILNLTLIILYMKLSVKILSRYLDVRINKSYGGVPTCDIHTMCHILFGFNPVFHENCAEV